MYLDHEWYRLNVHPDKTSEDPVDGLDVSILQMNLLDPVLGIEDPRTDENIEFVGGIRGLGELEKRCHEDMVVAFSMYPTSIRELLAVADAGRLMPPKSTWFEPKLRSGLFIHQIENSRERALQVFRKGFRRKNSIQARLHCRWQQRYIRH